MNAAVGAIIATALVATHTGSCIYPTATPVDVPEARGRLEQAGVVRTAEPTGDELVVTFNDGHSVKLGRGRQYVDDAAVEPGGLLVIGTTIDGDELLRAVPFDVALDCFAAYSPAKVHDDGLLLDGGLVVPLAASATDEDVLGPGEGAPAPRPLTSETVFYTHDAACLDEAGTASGIRRGTYEGGLPESP